MGIIVRKNYIAKLLCGLLFICTLQRSLATSQILALSEVKAILFSGCYTTRLVTVACVVISLMYATIFLMMVALSIPLTTSTIFLMLVMLSTMLVLRLMEESTLTRSTTATSMTRSIQRCFHVPDVVIQFFRVLKTRSDVRSTYQLDFLDFRVGYCASLALRASRGQ